MILGNDPVIVRLTFVRGVTANTTNIQIPSISLALDCFVPILPKAVEYPLVNLSIQELLEK